MKNTATTTQNSPEQVSFANAIYQQQARLFYQQLPTTMLGSIITSIVLVIIFYSIASPLILFSWLAAQLTLAVLRIFIARRFFTIERPTDEVKKWVRGTGILSFIAGSLWGLSSLLFFTVEPAIYPIALSIILFGTITATVTSYSSIPWMYAAYSLPVSLQLAYSFMDTGIIEFQIMAALIIVFAIANLGFSRNAYKSTLNAINLNLRNIELIEQLKQQKNTAEEASKAKSRFLAAASHDLRQPLQAMLLFIDNLSTADADQQQKSIDNIRHSSNALKELFDELLDISKLDAGIIKTRKENFNIEKIIQEIYQDQLPLLQQKQQTLNCHIRPAFIYSDPILVKRILQNIICNAMQYTPQGGEISIGIVEASAVSASISICDNGPGIPEDERNNIFDEFHQLHNPERDRSKGLGLGLAIVKRLIKLLGSEIDLKSAPGQGSCFSFQLPLGRKTDEIISADETPAPSQPLSGRRILIIEDEKNIRTALQETLNQWGCITYAADGIETALQLISQQPDWDLILSDFRLRNKDTGLEAISAVNKVLNKNIPAIFITGDTAPERIREASDSGYTLLHKPVKPAQLRLAISQALSQS